MRKPLLFLIFLAVLSCKGQDRKITNLVYSQKLEYRLQSDVKEVIQYTCNVKDGKIPADTSNYIGKSTMTFDNAGNVLTINRKWDFGTADTKSEYKMEFTGEGKDISFKEISNIRDKITEAHYKYEWSEDYNYNIALQDDSVNLSTVTLDKNYGLIKDVFKGDKIEYSEEIETVYKNDRLNEINKKTTTNYDGKIGVSHELQTVQQWDKYGNPTVIYEYNDTSRLEIKFVIFKEYRYY